MATLPVPSGGTYLGDYSSPSFVVGVSPPFPIGRKPAIGSPLMGPLVEVIQNFWPLWDSNSGTSVQDTTGVSNGVIKQTNGDVVWAQGRFGQGLTANNLAAADDVVVPAITLAGAFSLDRYYRIAGGIWVQEIDVNDPVADTYTTYFDGVQTSQTAALVNPVVITGLFRWDGEGMAEPLTLEYARIWARALTSYEVADLYTNPYSMFGVSQEVINEITAIIDFMKPIRSSWNFIY